MVSGISKPEMVDSPIDCVEHISNLVNESKKGHSEKRQHVKIWDKLITKNFMSYSVIIILLTNFILIKILSLVLMEKNGYDLEYFKKYFT